jgi:hypothetical protein
MSGRGGETRGRGEGDGRRCQDECFPNECVSDCFMKREREAQRSLKHGTYLDAQRVVSHASDGNLVRLALEREARLRVRGSRRHTGRGGRVRRRRVTDFGRNARFALDDAQVGAEKFGVPTMGWGRAVPSL